jgi:hypothetical protein
MTVSAGTVKIRGYTESLYGNPEKINMRERIESLYRNQSLYGSRHSLYGKRHSLYENRESLMGTMAACIETVASIGAVAVLWEL